ILDSRRFNDQLVFYTDLTLNDASVPGPQQTGPVGPGNSGLAASARTALPQQQHRALRVFRLGDSLQEEMYDTLIDTSEPQDRLTSEVTRDTPVDTVVSESQRFGQAMWASDHYFVVSEDISKTLVSGWRSYGYSTCTA